MHQVTSYKTREWELTEYEMAEFKPKKTKYALVTPIINEGERFKRLLRETKGYSKLLDIIIADGGSNDGSTNKKFLKGNGVRTLLVKTGPGRLGAQLRMAFAYAMWQGYEGVITMDGNGKDDTDSLASFISALENGYDYVQGSRFIRGGRAVNTPLIRLFAIRFLFSPILSLGARHWFTDVTNGHRAYSKKLLTHPKLKLFRNIFANYEILFYITARATRLGLKAKEIPVVRKYPKGKTPTKIIGFTKIMDVILSAIKASIGYYNP